MTATALVAPAAAPARHFVAPFWREPVLAAFAALLLALMLPTLLAWGLDDRSLRGVSVWAKPLKFMASIALFALTMAWLAGPLSAADRRRRGWRAAVWTVVIAGGLELAYITVMAARGEPSHYNASSVWHAAAYMAMGAGALAMTASQLLLAHRLWRNRPAADAAGFHGHRAAVVGLLMTFVLGAGAGAMLSGHQPPAGAGLPVLGWHLTGGDLRPAHFLGLHAQQLVPLGAAWLPRRAWWPGVAAYVAAWAAAMAMGMV